MASSDPHLLDKTRLILGARVKAERERRRLTPEAFAAHAGLTAAGIERLERGVANPTIADLAKLSTGLGVDVSELLEEPGTSRGRRRH